MEEIEHQTCPLPSLLPAVPSKEYQYKTTFLTDEGKLCGLILHPSYGYACSSPRTSSIKPLRS